MDIKIEIKCKQLGAVTGSMMGSIFLYKLIAMRSSVVWFDSHFLFLMSCIGYIISIVYNELLKLTHLYNPNENRPVMCEDF